MHVPIHPDPPKILVVGYGAAGQPIADGLAAAGAQVTIVDARGGADILSRIPDDLSSQDLIITIVTSDVTEGVAYDIAARTGNAPVLDLSSSPASRMEAVAAILGDRLVDGVILGAVALGRHRTPMLFAGKEAARIAALLEPLGCRIKLPEGAAVGDAGRLKLLRSIFTKGFEALVIELHCAAHAMGQTHHLPQILADLEEGSFLAQMNEMLRTHPRHAARRLHEVIAAQDAMREHHLPAPMTDAARAVFTRTAQSGTGPDESPRAALDWLAANLHAPQGDHR